jgi:hypothetical protein
MTINFEILILVVSHTQGWTGVDCGQALCTRYSCQGSTGICSLPDVCTCAAGYYGRDCSGACRCAQGACQDGNSGSGQCSCTAGFFDAACSSACTCVHGVCNDGAQGNGQCKSCDSGWLGTNCDLQVVVIAVPAAAGGLVLMALLVVVVRWLIAKAQYRAMLSNMDWKVPPV